MNQNEKYCYLDSPLPTDSEKVNEINTSEIMLYGSDCLVVFYESFSTPYRYTKIGMIEDITGLKEVLGKEDITITFSLSDSKTENLTEAAE